MNRRVIAIPFVAASILAMAVASCQRVEEDPAPVAAPAPAPAPKVERFTVTPLVTSSIDGRAKTAIIVDNQTGCILTMVAPNGPRPMMVDGKWAGCEEQPTPAVIPDEPAPEVAQ